MASTFTAGSGDTPSRPQDPSHISSISRPVPVATSPSWPQLPGMGSFGCQHTACPSRAVLRSCSSSGSAEPQCPWPRGLQDSVAQVTGHQKASGRAASLTGIKKRCSTRALLGRSALLHLLSPPTLRRERHKAGWTSDHVQGQQPQHPSPKKTARAALCLRAARGALPFSPPAPLPPAAGDTYLPCCLTRLRGAPTYLQGKKNK